MKKLTYLNKLPLVLFILFFKCASSQDVSFEWVNSYSSKEWNVGQSIVIDANKFIITIGDFSKTVDFDPGPGVYNLTAQSKDQPNIFISKIDSAGNFVWAKTILGPSLNYSQSITADVEGNIYATGFFQGNVDFDPGPGNHYLDATTGGQDFILKLDKNGNFIWAKQFKTHHPYCITLDASNDIIVAGDFNKTVDFDPGPGSFFLSPDNSPFSYDIFILKLSSNGIFIWAKQIKTTGGDVGTIAGGGASTVKTDAAKNIYISGSFSNTADFDPGPGVKNLISNGGSDIFISKFNKEGTLVWVQQMGGNDLESATSMELDNFGNIYTTGFLESAADFDPGVGTFILSNRGVFISKLDNNGNFIFAKKIGESTNNVFGRASLTLDENYNIYLVGSFNKTVDFDPGPGIFNITSSSAIPFILKLDLNGNFNWAKTFLDKKGGGRINCIKLDSYKNIYTTGSFYGTLDFDPNDPLFNETSEKDHNAIFIHKLSQCKSSWKNITTSSCLSYTLNGIKYDSSGIYYQTIKKGAECDSLVILNLTIYKPVYKVINEKICKGKSYAGYTASGTYIDTIFTVAGCDSVRLLNLEVVDNPKPSLGKDTNTCVGKPIQLTPGLFQNYLWSTGEDSEKITISNPGMYWVQVTDKNNCIVSDSITLKLSDNCSLLAIPNAFTPNGDGVNDVFKPTINMQIVNYVFTIYNRWGKKVFETNDHTKGWNGNINGIKQSTGNYIYIISFLGNANKPFLEKGNFILLK